MKNIRFLFTTAVTAEYFFKRHFEALIMRGYNIDLLCGSDFLSDEFKGYLKENKINLSVLNIESRYGIRLFYEMAILYFEIVKTRKKYDYYVLNTPKISFMFSVVRLFVVGMSKAKVVFYCHGLASYPYRNLRQKLYGALEAFVIKTSKASIFVSESLMQWAKVNGLISKHRKSYFVNSICGVDVKTRPVVRKKLLTVGYLARLTPDKGINDFFNLIERAESEGLKVNWKIGGFGGGKLEEVVTERVASLSNVEFLGRIEDKTEFFNTIDCLISPSKREGFGMSLLESSAHGCPVLGYRIPGVMDAVIDKRTGLLSDYLDIDALYKNITYLYRNSDVFMRLSQNGIQRSAEYFLAGRVVARHVEILSKIIEEGKSLN